MVRPNSIFDETLTPWLDSNWKKLFIHDNKKINMHIGNTLLITLLNMNRGGGSRRRKPLGNENMFR